MTIKISEDDWERLGFNDAKLNAEMQMSKFQAKLQKERSKQRDEFAKFALMGICMAGKHMTTVERVRIAYEHAEIMLTYRDNHPYKLSQEPNI